MARTVIANIPLRTFAVFLAGSVIGAGGMYAINAQTPNKTNSNFYPIREDVEKYPLISPLLACNATNNEQLAPYKKLKDNLNEVIAEERASGNVKEASVYVHEFKTGKWVGVDEEVRYEPASMMKVVLMIAYLRSAQEDPHVVANRYVYTQEIANQEKITPYYGTSKLAVGKEYSVGELLGSMITESDNGAKAVLMAHINPQRVSKIMNDLGLYQLKDISDDYAISPKEYSIFLRVLYNATYLNRQYSQVGLELLTHTKFNEGIVAGIPTTITVAHKYGEYIMNDSNGTKTMMELHDCGIIYDPHGPFLLCIMTKGDSIGKLADAIKHITQVSYDTVTDTIK